jgi:hypothetical protein
MLAASLIPRGNGNTGPLPENVKSMLIAGGVILGALILLLVVVVATSGGRARKKTQRLLSTGTPSEATVVLLQARANVTGLFDITVEVAGPPPFVAQIVAAVPLELLPSLAAGKRVRVRFDPADPRSVVLEQPVVTAHYFF